MNNGNHQIPTPEDVQLAAESSRILAAQIAKGEIASLHLNSGNETVQVPNKAMRMLVEILNVMSQGDTVSLVLVNKELTTQEAANILNVSRPFLVKLLEHGAIPHHKVGVRRKIMFQDLMNYKATREKESHNILDELVAEAQELDMGY